MDILADTLIDNLKLLPFLLITYLCMEYLEHKTSSKMQEWIKKFRIGGPLVGSILGALPQCGFSVVAANFYATGIIGIGTLMAIFLSTSDETLPILIANAADPLLIVQIICYKIICGAVFGYALYAIFLNKQKRINIAGFCHHEECHCSHGIIKPALRHTAEIFCFIFIITLSLNYTMIFIDLQQATALLQIPLLGEFISGFIGLIPNCSASVVLTQLYIDGFININTLFSGSLVNGGVGLLVLFRVNKNIKENLHILALLYACGVLGGITSCLFFQ